MENPLGEYKCQFTVTERKGIIAQVLRELRTGKNLSQKEVAAYIQVKPTTYNTYEVGRTEPPAEILVRLSYLYGIPVDILVAKDRLYRTSTDLADLLGTAKSEIASLEQQMIEAGKDEETLVMLKDAMLALVGQMQQMNSDPKVQAALDKHTGNGKK